MWKLEPCTTAWVCGEGLFWGCPNAMPSLWKWDDTTGWTGSAERNPCCSADLQLERRWMFLSTQLMLGMSLVCICRRQVCGIFQIQNYRIIQWIGLEGTWGPTQPPTAGRAVPQQLSKWEGKKGPMCSPAYSWDQIRTVVRMPLKEYWLLTTFQRY